MLKIKRRSLSHLGGWKSDRQKPTHMKQQLLSVLHRFSRLRGRVRVRDGVKYQK